MMESASSSSWGGEGGRHEEARCARDREAEGTLRILGFSDAKRVVAREGHERVLAAVAYVKSRRNVRGAGAYVRKLLASGPIPAPLLWAERPSPAEPLGWNDWRSLDGHQPEEVWPDQPEEGAAAFWVLCLAELEGQVTRPNFDTWLSGTVGLALRDGDLAVELVVGAASAFAKEWLAGKLRPIISRTASGLLGRPTEVEVVLFTERGTHGDETAGGGGDGYHRDGEP